MNKDAERENQKELEKLDRQIRADEKYIARAQKELERYSRIFEEAAEYLKSLSQAETFRLPIIPRRVRSCRSISRKWPTDALSKGAGVMMRNMPR